MKAKFIGPNNYASAHPHQYFYKKDYVYDVEQYVDELDPVYGNTFVVQCTDGIERIQIKNLFEILEN